MIMVSFDLGPALLEMENLYECLYSQWQLVENHGFSPFWSWTIGEYYTACGKWAQEKRMREEEQEPEEAPLGHI